MPIKCTRQILVLALTLTVTPSLTGFVLLGKNKSKLPVSNTAPEIDFVYDPDGEVPSLSKKEELLQGQYSTLTDKELFPVLLQLAMDQWNNVRGSYLEMRLVAATSTPQRSRSDGINVVLAESNTNVSTAAFATPETNPEDPMEIYDCDVSVSMQSTSASSMLETITHELGHCIGLGHPHNNYGAIMSYSRGGSSYKLGADDKAGLIFLYPDPAYGDGEPKELIGCGSIGRGRRASEPWITFLLIFPLATLLTLRVLRNNLRNFGYRNHP